MTYKYDLDIFEQVLAMQQIIMKKASPTLMLISLQI
jgi:hypothetical protein